MPAARSHTGRSSTLPHVGLPRRIFFTLFSGAPGCRRAPVGPGKARRCGFSGAYAFNTANQRRIVATASGSSGTRRGLTVLRGAALRTEADEDMRPRAAQVIKRTAPAASTRSTSKFRRHLSLIPVEARQDEVRSVVHDIVARVLGKRTESTPSNHPLMAMGPDSLMAVERR
jgi:hypothetical protein